MTCLMVSLNQRLLVVAVSISVPITIVAIPVSMSIVDFVFVLVLINPLPWIPIIIVVGHHDTKAILAQ
jgi:hypothetical protein